MTVIREPALEENLLQALHEISVVAAGGQNDPATVAGIAGSYASRLLDLEGVAVFVWNPASGFLEPLYETPSEVSEPPMAPGTGMVGEVFSTGAPLAVGDYQEFAGRIESSARRGMRSAIAVPMSFQGRTIGVIGGWSYSLRRFESHHLKLLRIFASQIAPAVEAARSLTRDRERRDALQALQDVAMAIAGVHDPIEVARLCVRTAADLLAADTALMAWYDDDSGLLVPLAEHNMAPGSSWSVPPGTGARGLAFATRKPVVVDDYPAWPHALPGAVELGTRSIAALPLVVRDRAVGVISVTSRQAGRSFDPREVETLGLFASLVAPDLEAAKLLERSDQRVRDLTALARARAEHENEMRGIYEAMACGVVVNDGEGRLLDINDNGLSLFGIGRDRLDGRMPSDIAGYERIGEDGSALDWTQRPMEIALTTGQPVRNRVVGYVKPGEELIWLQFDCVPVRDAEGRVVRVIGSFIDITAVKRAEAARRESEAKSRFLAGMSHELRTPLNSILGFAQLLDLDTHGPLTERQRRYLGHIRSSGQHLLELVNDVLDISKVAAGHMDFRVEDVDAGAVVSEVVGRARPLADERRIELHHATSAGTTVRADGRRVEQVLQNLVSNALKFTGEGGRVDVDVRRRRGEVVFRVRDNGIGIAAEHHGRIFEDFTQIDDRRSRKVEGSGLGLALSRRLVEGMKGRIWLQSKPGRGTSFYFSLPGGEASARRLAVQPGPGPGFTEASRSP